MKWRNTIDPPNNRGFYLKMKLLPKHTSRPPPEISCFFKYYKWLLWFSLSLYFFSSCFITNNNPPAESDSSHQSQSTLLSSPLLESPNITALNPSGVLNDLKIFVYDLPPKYNSDWLSNRRCSNHLFASEVAIHRALLTSEVRTFDPYDADFFFVPVYVSCNFSTVNGFPAIGHARSLISSAVQLISSQYTFWNRTQGSDHIFVASHDFGSCFHTLEDVAIADGIPDFLKKSIILQTFGVEYKHPCQDVDNVVIPPYVSPRSLKNTLEKEPANRRRDIWVFFRGKMELHPKNVSGRYYSKQVRTEIWRKFNADRRFYLQRQRFEGYQSEIARSVFCLCPLGWAPWSPRLVESVGLVCVPVIIADGIRLPFPWAVRWEEISVRVAEKDVGKLGRMLEEVEATNLSAIQRNLWEARRRRALLFNDEVEEGDATWQVLEALGQKLHKSYKRAKHQWGVDT
ncbi:probable glucuronoxylan glucuronosyltransferase IRX7 [Prosopis cineraria]|uniref:probable glucuronoxylan glucuronosyltransferase IRX7 n=1 Tax=Prosopis cineraria TaxID=364024 RepID=UPI0024100968|nr:probable glucuronoxylan glucuronosyltransferase IRX7 [Prosopis cineraria]